MSRFRFDLILAEQLKNLIEESPHEISRTLNFKCLPRKATVITGIRRSGKSTLLRQYLRSNEDHPPFYMTFFDERLSGVTSSDLNEALISYGSLYNGEEPRQYLLDEIQMIEGWENFVARLLENPKNQVYLTGSSSKLLSKEVATSLRGRSLSYELFPFSWQEYLKFLKVELKSVTSSQLGKQKKMFFDYLKWGGFPEVVGAPTKEKQKILKEYFEVLLFRDLVERNSFDHVLVARKLLVSLIRMYGNKFTINKTHKKLRAEGISLDKSILSNFIRWCEDAYIFFPIRLWTPSEQRARTNPQKLYLCDLGLAQACEPWLDQNNGRRFENACFIYLRALPDFSNISYYITQSGKEVDFLYENASGDKYLVQACWDLSNESKDREILALSEAMAELKINRGAIITIDQSDFIKVSSGKISVMSFDQFFKTHKTEVL